MSPMRLRLTYVTKWRAADHRFFFRFTTFFFPPHRSPRHPHIPTTFQTPSTSARFPSVSHWPTVVALDIVCLREHYDPGMAASTYGKTRSGVARAPCGYDRLFSSMNDLDLLPDSPILAAHSSRSLPPAQLSNRGVPVTPNPTTESGRSLNV